MTGLHLAQYRIDAELGRGGMGIVYRATDTKLGRTVALKVLPASALASEDDRARFFREAQAAAQLSHPNIAGVHQIDEAIPVDDDGVEVGASDGPRPFIAMEFIDGETVADRIKRAPLQLREAVTIAGQVAEALKAAHAKGIVHRDIKAANVMITAEGVAKVLDFGLAKTNQSTMLTRMGSTLGTVAYMSPEQARGQEVDGRTDLYSLGTMLYEMVAGRLPFAGDYEQAVLYGILNEPPEPLTALRTGVPLELERITAKLMSKEAEYRYQTAADLIADLKALDVTGSGVSRRSMPAVSAAQVAAAGGPATGRPAWFWPAIAAGMLILGLSGGWMLRPASLSEPTPVRRLTVRLPQFLEVGFPSGSSDGRYWALGGLDTSGAIQNYLWDVRNETFRPIDGSESMLWPRFSPDGSWILLSGDGLYRARVPSGRTLFTDSLSEGAWLDGRTVLALETDRLRLYRVSVEDQSRTPVQLDPVDSTYTTFFGLRVLGSGSVATVSAVRSDGGEDILGIDLESGRVVTMVRGACCAWPHQDRYLVYMVGVDTDGQVVAQRLANDGLSVTGAPVDLVSTSMDDWYWGLGADDTFFIMENWSSSEGGERISTLDPQTGAETMLPFPEANYDRLAVSPDGRKIVIERIETSGPNTGRNLFVFDTETGTEQRLTYANAFNQAPVWTRSGRIFYTGGAAQGAQNIYVKNADGTGPETLVLENGKFPSVSSDERWLAFQRDTNLYGYDLQDGTLVPIDTSTGRHGDAAISPNGQFVAYTTDSRIDNTVSSNQRLFVRSFPDPTKQYVQVIEDMADDPIWSPDGGTLYYRNNGRVSRIGVQTDGVFRPVSSGTVIARYGTNTPRLAVDPASGRLFVMRPAMDRQAGLAATVRVTLSFSEYLEELMGGSSSGS